MTSENLLRYTDWLIKVDIMGNYVDLYGEEKSNQIFMLGDD